MTILELSTKIDNQFKARELEQSKKDSELATRESALAKGIAELEAKQADFSKKEAELVTRESFISQAENKAREDRFVQEDRIQAEAMREQARKALKEATDARNEAQQKIDEQYKREIALSEEKKTYREEVKKEVLKQVLHLE